MENQNLTNENLERRWRKSHRRGQMIGGSLVILAGLLFLAREFGAELPHWLFSWKIFLIGLGVVMLVKHGFNRLGWIVPILIGSTFLLSDWFPQLNLKPILFPALLILLGLFIMFKPRNKFRHKYHRAFARKYGSGDCRSQNTSNEDFIDSTSVMGGVKKIILSKNFKGGDITNVFGGTEINLMQADFEGKITLEVSQVFGGTKLILPAHWHIQSDIVTVFGSVEDKRPIQQKESTLAAKVLVLEGSTFFGGLSITSY